MRPEPSNPSTGQLALYAEPNTTTATGGGARRDQYPSFPRSPGEGAGPDAAPAPSLARFDPTRRRLSTGRIVFLHPCRECGGRASFGYDCDLLANPPKPGTWYCTEHRP